MSNQPTKPSPEGLSAARQELDVLDALAHGVTAEISSLSKRPQSLGRIDANELALIDHRHVRLKGLQELAHRVYGRTVIGTEVDENDRPKGAFTYRITQANVGFTERGCFVLPRNSRLASELVTAQPGDQRDVETPTGERYLNVRDVRTLDGPVSLRSPSEEPNFRSMAIRRPGLKKPIVIDDLRATVRDFSISPDEKVPEFAPEAQPRSFDEADPTWLIDWSGIYLGDTDDQSLGHQFITRTTVDQERALSNPKGLTLVEGVAGAGKTSVALGRLKFFANFETGVERDYYGLQNASEKDFAPNGMAGFVLSHSLKRYLKETADALELIHLPIKDFEEFRGDLFNTFGISNRFRRKKGASSPVRSRMDWLRALDVAMSHAAATRLQENLSSAPGISLRVAKAVGGIATDLLSAEISREIRSLHLSGLAARIVDAISEAELREQEDHARVKFAVVEKADNQRRRNEEAALERELKRIQQQAERKLVSPLARLLLTGLNSQELFRAAVSRDAFPLLVRASFASSTFPASDEVLNSNVVEVRKLLGQEEERPSLPECDLVALAIFAGMISDGFEHTDQSRTLTHLYQMRKHTAVFIDEVQDFTEIEIVLMGMSATSAYNQITLSGDRHQQLQSSGAQNFEDLFPWIPRSARNRTIFLDQNFRQRSELAGLSSGFRSVILGDDRIESWKGPSFLPASIYRYEERERIVEFVVSRVRKLPHHATIAIILPTVNEAQQWFDLLEDDLGTYHRPALMSRRDDLTKRVNVHFTEVRETKGLEFDAVIVPDLGTFQLNEPVGRNQLYVAISRAKQSLMLGCANGSIGRSDIRKLEQEGLVLVQGIP
jgi:UvrD-like helicase C-terminal domain